MNTYRRQRCTCAGMAPGYPQHEWWCGRDEDEDEMLVNDPQLFWDVICEVPGCRHGLADDDPDLIGCPTTQADAIADAQRARWRFHSGLAICPCHNLNLELGGDPLEDLEDGLR